MCGASAARYSDHPGRLHDPPVRRCVRLIAGYNRRRSGVGFTFRKRGVLRHVEAAAMTEANGELIRLIDRNHPGDGIFPTAIPRLHLMRSARPTERMHALHEPAVCIAAQGRKRIMLGERILEYDRSRFLVVSVDVPVAGQIIEASAREPYLCLRLDLDPALRSEERRGGKECVGTCNYRG